MSLLSINEAPARRFPVADQRAPHAGRGIRKLIPSAKQAAISFGIALALVLINDSFVFESIVVPTSSMQPTILANERIILERIPLRSVRRFDVVVINEPATHKRIVKRIIGLPGERVRLAESWKVFINGQALAYSVKSQDGKRTEADDHMIEIASDAKPPATRFGIEDVLLGPDEYFVLGDNRLASIDSRVIGPVKGKEIQGIVSTVWYSFDLVQHRLRTERMPCRVH